MNKLVIAKAVTKTITGIGASYVIQSIIKNNVTQETLADSVKTAAGSLVLGMMISDIAANYTDAQVDKVAEWYNKTVKKNA